MSIRAVWILAIRIGDDNAREDEGTRTLFSKVYPTVERRVKATEHDSYVQLADNASFVNSLVNKLGLQTTGKQFIETRDGCKHIDQKPVFEVETVYGKVWPVLVIQQYGLLYCCLPMVEGGSHLRPPLIKISGLSAGFSLLLGMADFLGELPSTVDEMHPKLAELYYFVSQAAPFGTPKDTNPATVRDIMTKQSPALTHKQPAWKPNIYKGKSSLYFAVKEQIRAVQYDDLKVPNVWDVYGTVVCHAELEHTLPEVSVNLYSLTHSKATPPETLVTHPCVQAIESASSVKCKLKFTPPNEMFVLCQYSARVMHLPIKGFYQMKEKENNTIDLLVQLKLNENLKNSFSHCFVNLPFFNRGPVSVSECLTSQGNLSVSTADPRVLVWNIGQKFPSKTLEVILKATLRCDPSKKLSSLQQDEFCIGNNCYIQVYFKIADYSLTNCNIDSKTVQVTPSIKYKINSVTELQASDYKIWNSHGDAVVGFPVPTFLDL